MYLSKAEQQIGVSIIAHKLLKLNDRNQYLYLGKECCETDASNVYSESNLLFYDTNLLKEKTSIAPKRCIPIPVQLSPEIAFSLPPLCWALIAFELIEFELGEVLIIFGSHPFMEIFVCVARWRGSLDIIHFDIEDCLENRTEAQLSVHRRISDVVDSQISEGMNVCFLDFSGKPELVDLLFAVLPKWGRCILAGDYTEPITIDYYNNIHRKGVKTVSIEFDLNKLLSIVKRNMDVLSRAIKILNNDNLSTLLIQSRIASGAYDE